MTANARSNQYAPGHAPSEIERLIDQGRWMGDLTEQLFRDAGMVPGMSVLDVGCGAGDVSFLALSLVGPGGKVIGVDRAPEPVGATSEPRCPLFESCVERIRQTFAKAGFGIGAWARN